MVKLFALNKINKSKHKLIMRKSSNINFTFDKLIDLLYIDDYYFNDRFPYLAL